MIGFVNRLFVDYFLLTTEHAFNILDALESRQCQWHHPTARGEKIDARHKPATGWAT